MKKQIVFIHGGEAFSNYEDYLNKLRTIKIEDPVNEEEPIKKWKNTLKDELGEDYDVFYPSMPCAGNAKYEEWKIWFERYFEFLNDGVILIGHSQGGYFLAKYLSENKMPVNVKAVYLISAPFERSNFDGEDGGDFNFNSTDLYNLENQSDKVFVYHSKDDCVVPYEHALKYEQIFKNAELCTFKDRNHFLQEEFPELIKSIKVL